MPIKKIKEMYDFIENMRFVKHNKVEVLATNDFFFYQLCVIYKFSYVFKKSIRKMMKKKIEELK